MLHVSGLCVAVTTALIAFAQPAPGQSITLPPPSPSVPPPGLTILPTPPVAAAPAPTATMPVVVPAPPLAPEPTAEEGAPAPRKGFQMAIRTGSLAPLAKSAAATGRDMPHAPSR